MEGITSQWLLDKIDNNHKKLITKKELIPSILESNATVIVTIGAGDIGEMVKSIKKALNETL
jgi:UDP-N-acetylmuramate--alanine ligase